MSAILKVRQEDGTVIEIPAIVGPKGDPGAAGKDGEDYVLTAADKEEIATAVKTAIFTFNSSTGRLDITV